MQVWGIKEGDVVRFLKIVTDENRQPVFIHCQYGADRTGVMCAVYRIAVDGWSKPQAIGEMTKGGFGFHSFWTGFIAFITDLDVANIKIKAGLAK